MLKLRKPLNDKEIEFIKQNYINKGRKFCAISLKRSINSFYRLTKKLNLKVSKECIKQIHSGKKIKLPDTYPVLVSKFLNIEDSITAYLLGLIWADGNIYIKPRKSIYKIQFGSTFPDANYFNKIFDMNGKWNHYIYEPKNRPNSKIQSYTMTNNKYLAEFLISMDYRAKSNVSADKILETIPDHLKHYWFLGLLDGDGCIYVKENKHNRYDYSITITSSINQDWTYIENLFKKMKIKYSIQKKKTKQGQGSAIRIFNRKDCLKFLNYIYKNYSKDQIGLPRKYNKFLELQTIIKNSNYHFKKENT